MLLKNFFLIHLYSTWPIQYEMENDVLTLIEFFDEKIFVFTLADPNKPIDFVIRAHRLFLKRIEELSDGSHPAFSIYQNNGCNVAMSVLSADQREKLKQLISSNDLRRSAKPNINFMVMLDNEGMFKDNVSNHFFLK